MQLQMLRSIGNSRIFHLAREVTNDRRVSLITTISKVFEVLKIDFVKYKILSACQYGFQKNVSTQRTSVDIQTSFSIRKKIVFDTANNNLLENSQKYWCLI